jgi:hypothetical protein
MLKNLMPSIFDRITLRFKVSDTKPPKIDTNISCTLVGGEQIDALVITTSEGTIITRNDPVTKKSIPFRLTTSGKQIPIEEPKQVKRTKTSPG